MSTLSPYKVNSYRRICDICGRPRQIEHIRFSEGIAICDVHKEFRTAQQLNKINSRVRVPKVLPVPHPKAFTPQDTYQAAESQIFNWLTNFAATSVGAFESSDVTTNAGRPLLTRPIQGSSLTVLYLGAIIRENRRPAAWITRAKARMAVELNNTNGGQFKEQFIDSITYGLFTGTDGLQCESAGLAGLAFLEGYELLGTESYLHSAKRCAHALRDLQAGHLLLTYPSTSDSAGSNRKYWGAWSNSMSSGQFDHKYYPSSLVCLQFLTRLLAVAGDGLYGLTGTGGGLYTSSPSYLLSRSIEDGRAFWTDGALDVVSGTTLTGLSTTTPREFFNSYPAVKQGGLLTGTGSWEYQDADAATGTLITASNWCRAINALYALDGLSTRVASLYDYLMSFESNSAFEHAEGTGLAVIQRGQTGEYDPAIAPATLLKVRTGSPLAATAVNGSAFYDWASAGLLAPIHSVRDRVAFNTAKDELSLPRQRYAEGTPRDGETLYLGPLGLSGLSFQPWTTSTARVQSATRMAQVGMMYRYGAQAFTGQGH